MVFTYMYVCAPSVCSTSEGLKGVLDALEEQPVHLGKACF